MLFIEVLVGRESTLHVLLYVIQVRGLNKLGILRGGFSILLNMVQKFLL